MILARNSRNSRNASHRLPIRSLLFTVLAIGTVLGWAGLASAHTGTTATAAADGRTRITYSFSHGCSGAATIGLRAQVPVGATEVLATNPSGWSSTVSSTEVHWTGPPIADGQTAAFEVSMVLAQAAGTTVILPNVQECAGGAELAWIGAPSSDTSESSRPAPTIVVPQNPTAVPVTTTPAASPSTAPTPTTSASTGEARMATQSNAITNDGSEQSEAGRLVFFGVCAAIVVGAGVLFLKYRKRAVGN